MSNIKHTNLQILDAKHWSGLTREEHLAWLGGKTHQYIDDRVEKVYEMNYGADNLVSFVNKLPVHEVEEDVPYRWKLMGSSERNIPLEKASLTATGAQVSDADQAGLAFAPFYLWFDEKYFSAPGHIVGENPEGTQLRILEDPVQDGTQWRYKVKLFGDDPLSFVPAYELTADTRWKEMFAQVEQTLSQKGNDIHFASHYEMENTLSVIRKNVEVPGNMLGAKNPVYAMQSLDTKSGKKQTSWINKLEWEFFQQFRRDKARLFLYGKSNKLADGSYADKGQSGNTMRSGYGMYQQMEAGNVMFFNTFSIDILSTFALDLSIGRIAEDNREFILSTGERGAVEFHKEMAKKAGEYSWLRSGHNFKDGGKTLDETQMTTYVSVNGLKFHVMVDPMKDDPTLNTIRYKDGLASSYSYDIWDVGTTNGEANIKRVALKGAPEVFKVVPGMRDPYTAGGMGETNTPGITSSFVDGYAMGKMFHGGLMIRNVKKTGRLIPNVLK